MTMQPDSGGAAEEAIRAFLLRLGYFAARGIKFRFDGDEATDIDIWAYSHGSPTHRERIVVDSKYKVKGTHGFERLVWLEGIRRFAYAEHAILATTDSRESLRSAASRMNIRFIGPEQFSELITANAISRRMSEEAFLAAVVPNEDKLIGRVRERFETAKSRLLRLDWDALNAHIEDVTKYVDDSTRSSDSSGAIRLICLTVAFILVTLDFNLREATFMQPSQVASRIEEGLRFGTRGRAGVMTLLDALGKKKKGEALRMAETVRADIPAEFFHRHAGTRWFFDVARTLDSAAYSVDFVGLTDLPPDAQSAVGVILDFLSIDRRVVFRVKSA